MIFSKMEGGAVTQGQDEEDEGPPDPRKGLNPKVIEVYTKWVLASLWAGPH
jgi:essential nuclear protein 1